MTSIRSAVALAVLLAAGTSKDASAQQNSATTSASATATIVSAISIANTAELNFGQVVAGGTSGTVVLTTTGSRSGTGGVTLGNTGSTAAASFNVSGDPNAAYSITLPASATLTSGENSMTVNNFTSSPNGSGALSGGGSQTVTVGATLQVGASQPTGVYTGSFNVTVAYN